MAMIIEKQYFNVSKTIFNISLFIYLPVLEAETGLRFAILCVTILAVHIINICLYKINWALNVNNIYNYGFK